MDPKIRIKVKLRDIIERVSNCILLRTVMIDLIAITSRLSAWFGSRWVRSLLTALPVIEKKTMQTNAGNCDAIKDGTSD